MTFAEPVTDALTAIGHDSVWGALVVVLLVALAYLNRQLIAETQARVSDAKESRSLITEYQKTASENTAAFERATDNLDRAIDKIEEIADDLRRTKP